MNIKEKKERISDVMAIYIVQPTEENFKLIKSDLEKRVFDNYYINFVNKTGDETMRSFFSELIKTDNYNRVFKLAVNPIGFLLYHPQVFSLGFQDSYQFLNSPNVQEADIAKYFEYVGNGLYNVLFTLKTLPIIKYRSNSFAKEIVDVVQSKFDATFSKFPELKEEFPRKNNTLLLILDRDTDLPIMLHHGIGLGSIMNDVFGLSRSKGKGDKFEIDPLTDYIWNTHLSSPFVEVSDLVLEELKTLVNKTEFLDQNKNNLDDVEAISEKLSSTLEGLRDTAIKQTVLRNHMDFQHKLSVEIADRAWSEFYHLEEELLSKRVVTEELRKCFFDIITMKSFNSKGVKVNKNDILRLCLIYFLINKGITSDEVAEIERALRKIDINLASLNYLVSKKAFEESLRRGVTVEDTGLFRKYLTFMVDKIGSQINKGYPSIVADLTHSLSTNKDTANYVAYNLVKRSLDKGSYNFTQVIVFIVGGGSLSEYESIIGLFKDKKKNLNCSNIVYGCDCLYNQTQFLSTLEKLNNTK
jgi:hypothetical protein